MAFFNGLLGDARATLYKEFVPGSASPDISSIQVVGQRMYVVANSILHTTLATGALSTPPLTVLHSNVGRGTLMPWETTLYFAGFTVQHGYELWRTDGTTIGTYMVADLVPGPVSSYPGGGVSVSAGPDSGGAGVESKLIFRASVAENNHQLWATDGTTQGTVQLTNYAVTPGEFGSDISYLPMRLSSLGGVVVYEAFDPVNGRELWVTNGTVAGTQYLAGLRPGMFPDPNLSADPQTETWKWEPIRESIVYQGRLYFRLNDGSSGPELWTTDGTLAGTGKAVELIAGPQGGYPKSFKVMNDRLYFMADTLEFGIGNLEGTGELFLLNEAPTLSNHAAVIAPGATLNYALNGFDPDGDDLDYEFVTQPNYGTASITGGVLTYTPDIGFTGSDVMLVRANDGTATSGLATISVSALAAPNRISFTSSQTTVVEQTGAVRLTVELDQPAASLISIPYTIQGATAVANRNVASSIVTFSEGQQTAEILVYLLDNDRYQPNNQEIVVALSETISIGLGAIGIHTMTIVDNDSVPVVSYPDAWQTIVEDDVVVAVVVGLSNPSDQVVTTMVSLFANSGATTGVDFMAAPQTVVTFLPGQVRKLVPVRIVEDTLAEGRESVLAQISSVTNATVSQDPNKFRHLVFIQDDDISMLSLSPSNQVLVEGGTAQITLTRSGGNMSLPLEVHYTFSGDAQYGIDFTSPKGTSFDFAPGQTEASNTFQIASDGVVEGFEAFTLILNTNAAYILGEQDWSYVGIFDSDSLSPKITVSQAEVFEIKASNRQNRKVDVTVSLSKPSADTVTIPVRVSNPDPPPRPISIPQPPRPISGGNGFKTGGPSFYVPPPIIIPPPKDFMARHNIDYRFDLTDFVFAPGQTSITRQLEIVDDLDVEKDEEVQITIDPGQLLANRDDLHTKIIIKNDDRTLTFSGSKSVKEGDGSFVVTANLDEPADIPLVFPIQISGIANVFGFPLDVTFTGLDRYSPILIFNPGEQTKQFTVNIIDDSRVERAKDLVFKVVKTVDSKEQLVASHDVRLLDNDSPPSVTFGAGDGSLVRYDASLHVIPIQLSAAPGEPAQLNLEFGGTAKRGVDYEITFGLKPGASSMNVGPNETQVFIGIKPMIAIDSPSKTVEISIVKGTNVSVPSSVPKTTRVLYSPFAKLFLPPPAPVDAILPGQLAISLGEASKIQASGLNASSPAFSGVTSNITTSPGSLMISTGAQGLLAGSTSFLDLNFNGIRDFLDLNENLRHDEGEPLEPFATTNADGTFRFVLSPEFDRDSSGILESSEGRIVLVGGTDSSTGLPWEIPLTSPAGNFGVSPLSTLVEHVVRRGGLDIPSAMSRTSDALGIPGYELTSQLAIYQILNGDPLAEIAYAKQIQLSSLAILAGRFAQGAGGNVTQSALTAFTAMADRMLPAGSSAILSEAAFVRGILSAVNAELETPASATLINELSGVIAATLGQLDDLDSNSFASSRAYLDHLTRIKKILHGPLADDVRDVGSGTQDVSSIAAAYSSAAFTAMIPLQTIGDVIPPAVGVLNTFVLEGANGQTSSMVFEIAMLGEHNLPVSVNYATQDGTATLGEDYVATSGTLNWAPGDTTSRFVTVDILGDNTSEPDEFLLLSLSQPDGVAVRIADGYGFILNDDEFEITLPGGEALNNVSVSRSLDQLAVMENNALVRDLTLSLPSVLTLNSSASASTVFDLHFVESSLRSDFYELNGSSLATSDSIVLYGSQLSYLAHGGPDGSFAAFKLQSRNAGGASVIAYSDIEQVVSNFDAVDTVQLRLDASTAHATLSDADANEEGALMFAVPNGSTSITFRNPNVSVQVVSFHQGFALTPSVLDPGFEGNVEVLRGGTILSTLTVDKQSPVGSNMSSLSTEDPLFSESPTYELVTGEGDTGNAFFVIEGNTLKLAASLESVPATSLQIRLKLSNDLGESVEQVFTLLNVDTAVLTLDTEDGSAVTLVGGWGTSTSVPGFEGNHYAFTRSGSNATATFTPTIPTDGQYEVFVNYSAHPNRASNTGLRVLHNNGVFATTLDQRTAGGAFNSVGLFNFVAGTSNQVVISAAGTDGIVTADAVRFVRVGAMTAPPTAVLNSPSNNQVLMATELNDQGYIDIAFSPALTIVGNSIIDGAAEFTLSGPGVNDVVVNGVGADQGNGVFRYAFTGSFVPGQVNVNFIENSFEDSAQSGVGNVATQQSFMLTDGLVRITLDNTDATLVNTWASSSAIGGYVGLDYLFNFAGGAGRLTYTPNIPTDGAYEVFVNYTDGAGRATNAAYEVVSQNGTSVRRVNQQTGGGTFQSIGIFNFIAGTSGSVTLRASDADGIVIGDAVRFVRVGNSTGAPTATLADPLAGSTIVVTTINGRDYIDVTFAAAAEAGLNLGTITDASPEFTLSGPGAAGVTVNGAATFVEGTVSTYRYATTGDFSPGAVDAVFAAGTFADLDGNLNFDSIASFLVGEVFLEEVIVDNSDAGFVLSDPTQFVTSSAVGGFIGANYVAAPTGSTATATWTPTLNTNGSYQVYVRYTSHPQRASNATYVVTHGGGTSTVVVDQRSGGGTWVLLGTFDLANGLSSVQLRTLDANQFVVADAVRFVRV